MDSPGSRAPPPKSSPAQGQSWTPSTSYASPATPWMSAEGAPGKNSTTGAGGPRIPSTRPAECLHTRSCLLTLGQQYQILDLFSGDEHVALEVTWSVYQNITRRLPLIQRAWGQDFNARGNHAPHLHKHALLPHRAHHLGQDTQTPIRRHPGLLRPPAHQQRPHRSHQRTPSNTYADPPQDFRNLTHYITRALLETGGFKPQLHPQL